MTINRSIGVWTVRLLLAALFLFGSDVIMWTNPLDHTILERVIRSVGYVLLATLTLDIAQRYRIRDAYDAMVLSAASALLYSLIINPVMAWQVFPDSLLTRIIGGDALVQLILFGIFLAWMRGDVRIYWFQQAVGAMWLGIYWGFWMRWTPELRGTFNAVPLTQMFTITAMSFVLIVIFYLLITVQFGGKVQANDLMLTPLEWGIALMILIGLFLFQAIQRNISGEIFAVTAILLALCWLILWLRRDAEEETVLDKHLPLKMQNPLWIILIMAVFGVAVYLSYKMPLIDDVAYVNQLWLMEIGTVGVGILWLPIVASVIATRAIDRYMREGWTL